MAATAGTVVLGARIDHLEIGLGDNRCGQRLPETRPAGTAFVFHLAVEQGQEARRADEGSIALFVVQRACTGALGIFLEQHAIGGLRQQGSPFGFRFDKLHGFFFLGDGHLRGRNGEQKGG